LHAKRVALFALSVMNMLIWLLFSCRSNSFMTVSSAYTTHTRARRKSNGERKKSIQPVWCKSNPFASSINWLSTLFAIGREKWISQSLLTLHLLRDTASNSHPSRRRQHASLSHTKIIVLGPKSDHRKAPVDLFAHLGAIKAVSTQFALIGLIIRDLSKFKAGVNL
jgi:hypothetical protein